MVVPYNELVNLKKLFELRKEGLITDKEYQKSKNIILNAVLDSQYTSLDCIKKASELLEKGIINETEYTNLKRVSLNNVTQSNKYKSTKKSVHSSFSIKPILWLMAIIACFIWPEKIIVFLIIFVIVGIVGGYVGLIEDSNKYDALVQKEIIRSAIRDNKKD